MEGFSFVTPVTGLNRPNTGKEEDDGDEIKSRLKSGNAFSPAGRNVSPFWLLSRISNTKIYIVILHVVLCGCETWTLTLREEHQLSVSQTGC
jgi:hypothetical protein